MKGRMLLWSAVAMLAVMAGCQREAQVGGPTTAAADRRDCPKEWRWDSLKNAVVGAPTLSAPGEIQNVPEFHDCQRFVVVDSATKQPRYDGLFAIFATSRPGRLDTLVLMDSLRRDSTLVDTLKHLEEVAGFKATAALPSAEIWAPDAAYAPLKIEQGFSCLYLYLAQDPSGRRWRALMVSYGPKEADCSRPVSLDSIMGQNLSVQEDRGAPQDLVPRVAKWDWDSSDRLYYIGIYCGNRWCEVAGGDTFTPSKRFLERAESQATLPSGKRRVYGVRGWYDEQFLATVGAPGSAPRPTGILGTLIPDSLLGQRNVEDFGNTWVPAAEVSLLVPPRANNPYETKLNLAATTPSGALNKIALCHGANCPGVLDSLKRVSRDSAWDNWYAKITRAGGNRWDNWYAKITRAGGNRTMFRAVKRCDLGTADFAVPGTARWRWLANDETTWMRCAKGCCEVQ